MTTIRHVLRVARPSGFRLALHAGGSLLLAFAFAPAAGAQGFGPDPFRPYNSQYDSAVFGVAPGPMSPLGSPGLNQNLGVRGANQFEGYLESLGEGRGASRRYDQANRAYDRQFGRQYQPNRKADAGFEERQEEISDLYFRYLRENDPRKRAALLKEYKQARGRATRDLNIGSRNARNPRATRPQAPGAMNGEGPELDERSELAPEPGAAADRSSAARRRSTRRAAPAVPPSRPADSAEGRAGVRSPSEILERATESDIPPAPSLPRSGAPGGSSTAPPAPPAIP